MGGTVTYAAIAAQRLGMCTRMLTSGVARDLVIDELLSIEVVCRPSERTTTFENRYRAGHRQQRILAIAEPLTLDGLPPAWAHSDVVHLGPVVHEVAPDMVNAFPHALVGITPQGWLRAWDGAGIVTPRNWPDARQTLAAADVVVMSEEDVGERHLLRDYVRWTRLLILTVGKRGAIVYHEGREVRVPAYAVREVDPTGAGDVFAATFLVRLHETGDAIEAARYANCAASFVVERSGTAGIPTREAVEQRLARGHLMG